MYPRPTLSRRGTAQTFALFLALFFISPISQLASQARENYIVEEIPGPDDPDLNQEVDGLKIMPDGRIAACYPYGKVYMYDPVQTNWSLFAEGLHNPLGIIPVNNDELIVAQRSEVTRIRDTNGDGKADSYMKVSDHFGVTGNYHEFNFSPIQHANGSTYFTLGCASSGDGVRDEGRDNYYFADGKDRAATYAHWETLRGRMYSASPYRGWTMEITPEGETKPFASGFRTPNGLGQDLDGNLFVTDNQGDWLGTSKLFHVQKGRFYGHPASLTWEGEPYSKENPRLIPPEKLDKLRTRAAVLFPQGVMANSPTQPLVDSTEGKFGPFAGQLLVGEMNKSRIMRIMLEEVGGELQGACVPFIDGGGLSSGNNRLAFDAAGSLWVGSTKHTWSGSSGIRKITWDKKMPFDLLTMNATPTGFKLTFTEALDPAIARDPNTYTFDRYYYEYHEAYGSDTFDQSQFAPTKVALSEDGKVVTLTLPEMRPWYVHQLIINKLTSAAGRDLENNLVIYTLNRVPGKEDVPPPADQVIGFAKPGANPKETKKKTKSSDTRKASAKKPGGANPLPEVYESESAKLNVSIKDAHEGYYGHGYADFSDKEDQFIEWTVDAKETGSHQLLFRYALGGSDRSMAYKVDQSDAKDISFTVTDGWKNWNEIGPTVELKKGQHTIRLLATGNGGPNVDSLRLVKSK